jgi:sugar transferase (PEP-CTERM/EpsH1 system associated)
MNMHAQGDTLRDTRPLIAHVMFRFDIGGLENGVVNLINRLPEQAYRHAIVSLTEITDFRKRVLRDDVQYYALGKKPGQGFWLYPKLVRLFRRLSPDIVHTRNLAALEASLPAWLAGVTLRVHGEHGRDVSDLDGSNRVYKRNRRLYRPFVNQYVAVSKDLEQYLSRDIGVDPKRIVRICNGVDTVQFAPGAGTRSTVEGCPFKAPDHWLIGTVGRMQPVKDQVTLAHAFVRAIHGDEGAARRMRLVIIGDGPQRAEVGRVLGDSGLGALAWLPGERSDVADLMRSLDCFVLPSLVEGISNTILEAMATGLPVLATRVGGNVELIDDGTTGRFVPIADSEAMAKAIVGYFYDAAMAREHGVAARQAVLERFSLDRMVRDYGALYDGLLLRRGNSPVRAGVIG